MYPTLQPRDITSTILQCTDSVVREVGREYPILKHCLGADSFDDYADYDEPEPEAPNLPLAMAFDPHPASGSVSRHQRRSLRPRHDEWPLELHEFTPRSLAEFEASEIERLAHRAIASEAIGRLLDAVERGEEAVQMAEPAPG